MFFSAFNSRMILREREGEGERERERERERKKHENVFFSVRNEFLSNDIRYSESLDGKIVLTYAVVVVASRQLFYATLIVANGIWLLRRQSRCEGASRQA